MSAGTAAGGGEGEGGRGGNGMDICTERTVQDTYYTPRSTFDSILCADRKVGIQI